MVVYLLRYDILQIARKNYCIGALRVDGIDRRTQHFLVYSIVCANVSVGKLHDAIAVESLWNVGRSNLNVAYLHASESYKGSVDGHSGHQQTCGCTNAVAPSSAETRDKGKQRTQYKHGLWHDKDGKELQVEVEPDFFGRNKVGQ